MRAWKRELIITLTSSKFKKQFVFGNNSRKGGIDLEIDVTVHKYMSSLKDVATIKIANLTYTETTLLMMGEFYNVNIFAGYEKQSNKIFDGGVLYISNKLNSDRTNTVIILCASHLVAKYGQKRMNLSLNSGINVYSAIKFICRRAGIGDANISTQLKKQFLKQVVTSDNSVSSWIDNLCKNNTTYITNSDSILSQTLSIFDAAKSNARRIVLDNNKISLVGGYPKLTSNGLDIYMLPTFNFMCGDVIKIDNSIIDVSVSTANEVKSNYGMYFSQKGEYMIFEIEYSLSNRSNNYMLTLKCKNRDRISNYVGVK